MGKEENVEFLSNFSAKAVDLVLCHSFPLSQVKMVLVVSLEPAKSSEILRRGADTRGYNL